MKIFQNTLIIALCYLSIQACKKDEDQVVLFSGEAPSLSSSNSVLILDKSKEDEDAISFNWTDMTITWSDPNVSSNMVTYTLQFDTLGGAFAKPQQLAVSGNTQILTTGALNAIAIALKAEPDVERELIVRLQAKIANNIDPSYSNTDTIRVTAYRDIISYPSLYLAGGFNNWTHSMNYRVASVEDDGSYEGYLNIPDDNTEFKFSTEPNWNGTNYGAGSGSSLSQDSGAGNLSVAEAGFYLLKADINTLTWEANRVVWGVIGDATGSWDISSPMTYNTTTGLWSVTLHLNAGALKFRANDDWAINLGGSGNNNVLKSGGDNISISAAGTYVISLDLTNPGYYTYTLEQE